MRAERGWPTGSRRSASLRKSRVRPMPTIQLSEVRSAAAALRLQVHVRRVSHDDNLEPAFNGLAQESVHTLMAAPTLFIASRRGRLVSLAAKHRLPAMWEWPDFIQYSGLMSYRTSFIDGYRQVERLCRTDS